MCLQKFDSKGDTGKWSKARNGTALGCTTARIKMYRGETGRAGGRLQEYLRQIPKLR